MMAHQSSTKVCQLPCCRGSATPNTACAASLPWPSWEHAGIQQGCSLRPLRAQWPTWLRLREVRDEESTGQLPLLRCCVAVAFAVNCRIDLREIKVGLRPAIVLRAALARRPQPGKPQR